ncbi:beta-lactamase family protein [bacterium]|nr:beta-lactamase family protein [bacterium]
MQLFNLKKLSIFITVFIVFGATLLRSQETTEKIDLNTLRETISQQLTETGVPGMSVVIIDQGKIVMLEGFGVLGVDKTEKVNTETIFPIGSTAKPMTSSLAALMVSEGMINWDDPVQQYLPNFKLNLIDPNPEDQVTLRDLLSHRSGYWTMDLSQVIVNWTEDAEWGGGPCAQYTRQSLLKAFTELAPRDTFRTKHHYSNLSMLAAAMACEKAAGQSWDVLIQEKLFSQLDMTRTTTSVVGLENELNMAQGHMQAEGGFRPAMRLNMDLISPAGGINSTANDMARWMMMLIDGGQYNGKQILKPETIQAMWEGHAPCVEIMSGSQYGLGWFVRELEGHRFMHHPGNALGYSTDLEIFPDLKSGFAILSTTLPDPAIRPIGKAIRKYLFQSK